MEIIGCHEIFVYIYFILPMKIVEKKKIITDTIDLGVSPWFLQSLKNLMVKGYEGLYSFN